MSQNPNVIEWRYKGGLITQVIKFYEKNPKSVLTAEELAVLLHRPPGYVRAVMRQLVREGLLKKRINYELT